MPIKQLSPQDAVVVLEIIHGSLRCSSEEELRRLMGRLSELLPYQAALSCMGRFDRNSRLEELKIVNVDYPEEYLHELAAREIITKDPVVRENFRNFSLQYWADTLRKEERSRSTHEIISLAEDYGFTRVSEGCGYAFGLRNVTGSEGSLFCYHGLERSPRSEAIFSLVIPHLHVVLARLATLPQRISPLTSKESEVLVWAKAGKSTWDISVILGVSERTVKFHVANIMHKLDATSRIHAVAIAMENGYIEAD